jgi:hypothetical protein
MYKREKKERQKRNRKLKEVRESIFAEGFAIHPTRVGEISQGKD